MFGLKTIRQLRARLAALEAQQKSGIDWSKRMLVISKESGIVVQTDGSFTNHQFAGTCLAPGSADHPKMGDMETCWSKHRFDIYRGALVLSNFPGAWQLVPKKVAEEAVAVVEQAENSLQSALTDNDHLSQDYVTAIKLLNRVRKEWATGVTVELHREIDSLLGPDETNTPQAQDCTQAESAPQAG